MFRMIQEWNQLTEEQQQVGDPPIKASTLRQRLGYVKSFFDFLRAEYLYAGLTHQDMTCATLKIEAMQKLCAVSVMQQGEGKF